MAEIDDEVNDDPRLAGGETTLFRATPESFATPAPNLEGDRLDKHLVGDVEFEQKFVAAPAALNSGLGPLFNRTSCASCHTKNGRDVLDVSLLMRVSMGQDAQNRPIPVPGFGLQIQERSVPGFHVDASVRIQFVEESGTFSDGKPYSLRRPTYFLEDPFSQLPADVLFSPRMARPVFGLGLLEAITEETLQDLVVEQQLKGQVSGRINYVWDRSARDFRVGRFGWKANEPSVRQQTADAYNGDMGITSPLVPTESIADRSLEDGLSDDPEIDNETLDVVAFYMQTLAVPAARNVNDPIVNQGRKLFQSTGCASCHIPRLQTGTLPELPEVSNQIIFPYTDLLLHDMGDDLADGRPDFLASGREWRTPPLWGLGLTRLINQHTQLLHDGRARDITEAILWHGGEAEKSREQFRHLSEDERDALLTFLESL